ncbi:hypothetical protein [Candidatus Phytoplasma sp. AldY-WA1]|uniref:hypothetical protein n=1 Tax=Candidatus Phytoplasma sp. AldY-WA1 TaxID=2852100 RepID=UPI00254ED0C2|nr:hypothetical protein [Candidatus Phytoplasma sp. AldY-WA1]
MKTNIKTYTDKDGHKIIEERNINNKLITKTYIDEYGDKIIEEYNNNEQLIKKTCYHSKGAKEALLTAN